MRNSIKIISIMLLAGSLMPLRTAAQDTFTNLQERASYGIGLFLGNQIKRMNPNLDVVAAAMREVLEGKEPKMDEQTARKVIMEYQQALQKELVAKNEKEGAEFLAQNKNKPGVMTKTVTLSEGKTAEFQYKILAEGSGDSPKASDVVSVNYRGTLVNGKEFDSNAKSGQPVSFAVGGVIRGWTEALQMMKPGAKWELYIPAELAYRDRGQGAMIEPGSTLIFEVELLSFETPKPPAPAQPTTSDIIKVPSAEEMKAGKQIEVIKAADAEKMAEQARTNKAAQK